jgi:hypothetical protein
MKTMFSDSAHGGAVRTGQPAWRRALVIMLIALLSPVPALFAFWADANSDGQPDSWVDPLSGHVFTLAELDAFSDDIDGDGLSNAQEMSISTNPFSPDTDGDGISDLLDPLPLTASNLSPANGIIWGAIALDDADGDGIPNFLDDYPYGQYGAQLGTPDTDGDGIPDFIDPAPWDYSNWSPINGLQWMGDALADADGDGVPNFHDWYPYDSALWDPQQDPDGDGLVKAKDPRPADPYNPSPVNGLNWGSDVYGDADGDGIPNFYDVYPYDSGNGFVPSEPDSDGDGIPDSVDPSPWDYDNFSAANGVSWQWDARGDADGDGLSNFYDHFPYDYYNGNVPVFDQDGDGIPDAEDPAPSDPTNLSPINGGLWYTAALADADGDGNPNFTDPWPYDPTNGNLPPEWNSPTADTDGDGIANAQDPALADPLNFSIYNGTAWYGAAVGDIDGDGIVNFQDAYPYDYYNGGYAGPDSDGDGIPDSSDPYPNDPNNGNGDADGDGIVDSQDPYPFDATNGGTAPEPDTDGDGRPDSQDPYPNDPYDNADFDHDGITDVSDPAQADPNNPSPINGYEWFGDVRGDADGDGILNFWDLEPHGPTPVDTDGDGLLDSIDPAPADPYNFSAYNKTSWSSDALGDADGDGIPNYFDTWPYDSLNGTGDADMDGLPDASDPVPDDPYNNSPYNGAMWSGPSALGDVDNDGILNYFDAYPDDPYNGLPPGGDADGDGIPNEQDPDPRNGTNTSPSNGINWGEGANGDADNDGTANYWDYSPYGDDLDGDGLRDTEDPAPNDATNTSPHNLMPWPGLSAVEDDDLDGITNFDDPAPHDAMPYEPYLGEMPSASASQLVLLNDGYEELGEAPAPGVTPARDLDDPELAIKAGPRAGKMAISKLTALNLSLPADYVNAGGSVTFTQSGAGLIRLHAVRMVDGEGIEDREISMGVPYVPPDDGTWVYLIESVSGGGVTLTCHFPWMLYGEITGEHPSGVMSSQVEVDMLLLPVKIKEVSFAGSNYHELKSDDGNTTYNAPQWVDVNGDGTATTSTSSGEKNYPVSFTRNTKPQVGGKFKVAGLPSGQIVKIKASSAQGLQIPETSVTPATDGTITLPLTTASNNLVNSIQFHNADDNTALKIDWEISIGSGGWSTVGSTKHTVYITMADPIKTATGLMRETLFNLGCRNAKGKGSAAQAVVDAIYDDFKDRDVQRVKPSSGTLDGTGMKYWGNPATAGFETSNLLATGDGRCGSWCKTFVDILRCQGIDAAVIMFTAPEIPQQNLSADIQAQFSGYQGNVDYVRVLYVKSWTLGGNPFNPLDNPGVEGQGNQNPQAWFGDHSLVEFGGRYYDPSYGSTVYATQQAWEDASIDAFGAHVQFIPAPAGASAFWIWKPDNKGTQETIPQNLNY